MGQQRTPIGAHSSFGSVLRPVAIVPPGTDDGIWRGFVANFRQRVPPPATDLRDVVSSRVISFSQGMEESHRNQGTEEGVDRPPVPGLYLLLYKSTEQRVQTANSDREGHAKSRPR